MRPIQHPLLNPLACLLACAWIILVSTTLTSGTDDFKQYWQAAVNVQATGNPYTPPPNSTTVYAGYYYPPLFAYLFQPFAALELQTGQQCWYWLNSLALVGFLALALWVAGARSAQRYWGIVILATAIAPPTRLSLQLGQISIFFALFLVATWGLRQRPALAGGILAYTASIRIIPALLGLAFLLQRRRAIVWWAVIIGGVLIGGTLAAYGWQPYWSLFTNQAHSPPYPYAAEHNISWFGFFSRLFTNNPYSIPIQHLPQLVPILTVFFSLPLLSSAVWLSWITAQPQDNALLYSLWLCLTLILAPTNGYYSLVLLLFPLLVIMRQLEQAPNPRLRTWLIIATALVCLPPGWTAVHPLLYQNLHQGWGLLLLTPSMYGLILYSGLLSWILYTTTLQASVQ